MSGNIHAKEYRLSKIFSSDFEYVIPPYQRPMLGVKSKQVSSLMIYLASILQH